MCNCYDLANHHIPWHADLERISGISIPHLDKPINIRKTDSGMVARMVEDRREAIPMRWGFHRHFNPAVNNTRADKLDSNMWAEAWQQRRCVVPVGAFYEWSGPKGKKQTHAFVGEGKAWLWAAGIWEESSEHGLCFSMITVDANSVTEPIHNRMPALLSVDEIDEFMESNDPRKLVRPYEGYLKTFTCQNPLRMSEPSSPIPMEVDQELF